VLAGEVAKEGAILWWKCTCGYAYTRKLRVGQVPPTLVVCGECGNSQSFLDWPMNTHGAESLSDVKGVHTLDDMLAIVAKGPRAEE